MSLMLLNCTKYFLYQYSIEYTFWVNGKYMYIYLQLKELVSSKNLFTIHSVKYVRTYFSFKSQHLKYLCNKHTAPSMLRCLVTYITDAQIKYRNAREHIMQWSMYSASGLYLSMCTLHRKRLFIDLEWAYIEIKIPTVIVVVRKNNVVTW